MTSVSHQRFTEALASELQVADCLTASRTLVAALAFSVRQHQSQRKW